MTLTLKSQTRPAVWLKIKDSIGHAVGLSGFV